MNDARLIVVAVDDRGVLSIGPPTVPEWIKTSLESNRAALLSWVCSPCPGFEEIPPGDLPLVAQVPDPDFVASEVVCRFMNLWEKEKPFERWLVARARAYREGPGKDWTQFEVAWASSRDCLCWQLGLSEEQMLAALRSLWP